MGQDLVPSNGEDDPGTYQDPGSSNRSLRLGPALGNTDLDAYESKTPVEKHR
jgi:hypothetical protein